MILIDGIARRIASLVLASGTFFYTPHLLLAEEITATNTEMKADNEQTLVLPEIQELSLHDVVKLAVATVPVELARYELAALDAEARGAQQVITAGHVSRQCSAARLTAKFCR